MRNLVTNLTAQNDHVDYIDDPSLGRFSSELLFDFSGCGVVARLRSGVPRCDTWASSRMSLFLTEVSQSILLFSNPSNENQDQPTVDVHRTSHRWPFGCA
jgi:hypothetical protein